MRTFRIGLVCALLLVFGKAVAIAGDFDWMRDLTVRAEADPAGFRATLAARFQIGEVKVAAVMKTTDSPADAYMVLRLGEMSAQPVERVAETYRAEKHQGWGAMAKSLGIKPGSPEFHALKQGHDLGDGGGKAEGAGKAGDKGRGKKDR